MTATLSFEAKSFCFTGKLAELRRSLRTEAEPQVITEAEFYERRGLKPDRLSDSGRQDDRLVRQAVETDEISLSRGAEILHIWLDDMASWQPNGPRQMLQPSSGRPAQRFPGIKRCPPASRSI